MEADPIFGATQLSPEMPDSGKISGAKLIKREPRIQDVPQEQRLVLQPQPAAHSINLAPLEDLVAGSHPGGALLCLTRQHGPLGWPRCQHAGKRLVVGKEADSRKRASV